MSQFDYPSRQHTDDRLEMSIAELPGISERTINVLERKGILTVLDLLMQTRESLLRIKQFGEEGLNEVFRGLKNVGFIPGEHTQNSNGTPPANINGSKHQK